MFETPTIDSPCVKVCQIDKHSGFCKGCYRTQQEILDWWNMSFEEQSALVKLLWERQVLPKKTDL
jgi:uncharacterized protein